MTCSYECKQVDRLDGALRRQASLPRVDHFLAWSSECRCGTLRNSRPRRRANLLLVDVMVPSPERSLLFLKPRALHVRLRSCVMFCVALDALQLLLRVVLAWLARLLLNVVLPAFCLRQAFRFVSSRSRWCRRPAAVGARLSHRVSEGSGFTPWIFLSSSRAG